jgi:hypothetical protein
MDGRRYSIGELAEITGVSRRTVHFYVQRRLVDPPLGRGRGRHYDHRHVEQIRRVRELQRLGVSLAEIGDVGPLSTLATTEEGAPGGTTALPELATTGGGPAAIVPGVEFWPAARTVIRLRVDQNVTVELSGSAGPLTQALVADLSSALGAVLRRHGSGGEEEQP